MYVFVKAIAWCPWQQSLLASGGGTADRQIRLWNVNTGACLQSTETNSQVRIALQLHANSRADFIVTTFRSYLVDF